MVKLHFVCIFILKNVTLPHHSLSPNYSHLHLHHFYPSIYLFLLTLVSLSLKYTETNDNDDNNSFFNLNFFRPASSASGIVYKYVFLLNFKCVLKTLLERSKREDAKQWETFVEILRIFGALKIIVLYKYASLFNRINFIRKF